MALTRRANSPFYYSEFTIGGKKLALPDFVGQPLHVV